jgi:hypothetical protein
LLGVELIIIVKDEIAFNTILIIKMESFKSQKPGILHFPCSLYLLFFPLVGNIDISLVGQITYFYKWLTFIKSLISSFFC